MARLDVRIVSDWRARISLEMRWLLRAPARDFEIVNSKNGCHASMPRDLS
jgi:hypothetical protein